MTSSPLPPPLCGGRLLGTRVSFLLILGTTLLSSVTVTGQGKKDLKCQAMANEKSCRAEEESCCFYLLDSKKKKDRWGCTEDCADLSCKPHIHDKESIRCYCVEDNCNGDKNYWKGKKDSLYDDFHKTPSDKGASGSTTRPSGIKGPLLLVVAALGSLSHLLF